MIWGWFSDDLGMILRRFWRQCSVSFVLFVQSGFGQEDGPGGHKTVVSEQSINLAEVTRVLFAFSSRNMLRKAGF